MLEMTKQTASRKPVQTRNRKSSMVRRYQKTLASLQVTLKMTILHGKSVHKGTLKYTKIRLKYNVLIQKLLIHVSALQPKLAATKSE